MKIDYTDPSLVKGIRISPAPRSGQTATGYGGQIPTEYELLYKLHWRRVYAMVYSNSGSLYVRVKGEDFFIDSNTENDMQNLRLLEGSY